MADGFTGMAALIEGLQRMPTALEHEASAAVTDAADTMYAEVINEYAEVTGNLKQHVRVIRDNAFRNTVKSTAKHAHIYERGSVERHHATGKSVGSMPKANVFIPAAIKARHAMRQRLIRAVESQTVPGMTGRLQVIDRGDDHD